MTSRDRIAALVVISIAALAGFWFAVLGPKRNEASKLSGQVTEAHARLDTARASAAAAEKARAGYERDYATVAKLGKAVPADDDLASLVYQIQTVSHGNNIDFRSIKLDSSASSGAAAAPQVATPGQQVAQANSESPGGAQPTTPATTPASTPATTQAAVASLPPGASVGAAGFPVMPFSFTFDGNFFDMEHFLRALARATKAHGSTIRVSGRLLTIDSLSLTAGRTGFPKVQALIKANAFLTPPTEGLLAGATPAGPTTTAPAPAAAGQAATPPAATASLPGVTP